MSESITPGSHHQAVPDVIPAAPVIDLRAPEPIIDLRGAPEVQFPPLGIVGDRYDLGTHVAEVIGEGDPRVPELIDIEVAELVALGDRETEARAWLADTTDAVWAVLVAADDRVVDANHAHGLVRLTMRRRSDRGLRDLAVLLKRSYDDVAEEFRATTGVRDFARIADLTTFLIDARSVPGGRERSLTAERLLRVLGVMYMRILDDGVDIGYGLSHPALFRVIQGRGWPTEDVGYGTLKYELTSGNPTPLPTIATWGPLAELRNRACRRTTASVGRIFDDAVRSGFLLSPTDFVYHPRTLSEK